MSADRAKQTPSILPKSRVPKALLFRPMKPNWPALFTKLGEFDPANPTKWPGGLYGSLEALFKLEPRSVEEEVHLLVQRALVGALADATEGVCLRSDEKLSRVAAEFSSNLDARLASQPIEISSQFFRYPGRTRIVSSVASLLASWLRRAGIETSVADSEVLTFPARFVSKLSLEVSEHAGKYPKLIENYSPNFAQATEEEAAWLRYYVELQTRSNPPVLNLGVCLEDVYVELRAFTEKYVDSSEAGFATEDTGRKQLRVGMLNDMAQAWVESEGDPVFVVQGGPGAGKSAFARRFAAWRAWTGAEPWRVLFVPLHRFKLEADLQDSLNEFASLELRINLNLFDHGDDSKLLVVFDGLDELAQRGKFGEELAAEFYRQVDDFVKHRNQDATPLRVRAMICGRPVSISSTNADRRKAESVRHVLPYKVDNRQIFGKKLVGQVGLLAVDQRDEWWARYGVATCDSELVGLPPDLRTEKLDPLTSEPILNGLIAESRKSHKITPDTNRAKIYEWLLCDVINRVHDKSGKQHLKDADENEIARLLEEVAVTAWHSGDVRATTKTRVLERCEATDQTNLLNAVFPDKKRTSISSLFLAFYFQEAGERQGEERAFEFSHKSFGEYLLARRIIRFVSDLSILVENKSWDGDIPLQRWVELFGPSPIDSDLCTFLKDLTDLKEVHDLHRCSWALAKLFDRISKNGMPMTEARLKTFREMERQNRNAIRSFFALHSICYRPVQEVKQLSIGDWLNTVAGQTHLVSTEWTNSSSIIPFLNGARILSVQFVNSTLRWAQLQGSDLSDSQFWSTSLYGANLEGANLSRVYFVRGGVSPQRMGMVALSYTDMRKSNLCKAIFHYASLEGAVLDGANIEGADFTDASVTLDQLRLTIGEPALMPNGKPPSKTWRRKRSRKRRSMTEGEE